MFFSCVIVMSTQLNWHMKVFVFIYLSILFVLVITCQSDYGSANLGTSVLFDFMVYNNLYERESFGFAG